MSTSKSKTILRTEDNENPTHARIKRIAAWIFVAVCMVFIGFCVFAPVETERVLLELQEFADGIGVGDEGGFGGSALWSDKNVLTVHFVDVDQAKAIVVTAPTGENMLVDAGSDASEPMLLSYLESIGVEKFELAVFTHPHEDHIGGADAVLREYEVNTVMLPDLAVNTSAFENMLYRLERCRKNGGRVILPVEGQRLELGEVSVTVLSGHEPDEENINNSSVVLMVEYGQARVLLTGDAEAAVEERLVKSGARLDAQVLDMAHHGSDTSSTEEFLCAVKPEIAVISCGVDNAYGHPSFSVINRLNSLYIPFYRTDSQGTVVVKLDGAGNVEAQSLGKAVFAG